jgi:Zn-dependent protease
MEKKSKTGWIAGVIVVAKLVPKFLKLAGVAKVGLAAASFGVYATVFNWQFAIFIVSMLFIHESGHVWAMKRHGMKTKGFYFVPFFGAVAVADDKFPSRKAEAYIALMGPIWGLVYSVVIFGIFGLTQAPICAAAASWMAFITLFNLLPINPLDGGRVMKSIVYSISSRVGFVVMIATMALAVVIMVVQHIYIFVIFIGISLAEILGEKISNSRKWRITREYEEQLKEFKSRDVPTDSEKKATHERNLRFLEDMVKNRHKDLQGGLTPMTKSEIAKSALGYLGVAAISFAIMFAVDHIPSAELALQVLVD